MRSSRAMVVYAAQARGAQEDVAVGTHSYKVPDHLGRAVRAVAKNRVEALGVVRACTAGETTAAFQGGYKEEGWGMA